MKPGSLKRFYVRLCVVGGLGLMTMTVGILALAGRLDYWQGWLFGSVCIVYGVIKAYLFADNIDLIRERVHPGPGTKWWDKVFYLFFIPLFGAIIVIGSLDSGRFGWTGPMHPVMYGIGYVLFGLSVSLFTWAMAVNRFFSSTVRLQWDRGHEVVRDGPYQYIRHPGYLAGVVNLIAMPLMLGSVWAYIPSIVLMGLLIVRTTLEDRTLHRELTGYDDYAKTVKYRLIPGCW